LPQRYFALPPCRDLLFFIVLSVPFDVDYGGWIADDSQIINYQQSIINGTAFYSTPPVAQSGNLDPAGIDRPRHRAAS
jgi:hypothetical protein